ncbi:MFS transporter [Chiayiivirga flava]|uniref:Putative MFS family arabinose efflux permease n=1 Tax=Chiayiivirga flava TaxID=659595 RepID=A0A7W8D9Z6_9GAMM|nr:MFS transporter [Chiayiivirga flava]MBB5209296.1 putative MFS family arabinose efflux permease [Chiayiivirga flava]
MNASAQPGAAPAVPARVFLVVAAAAAVLMVTMGARQSLGLFVAPIQDSSGLGLAAISLALAVGQLMWGVAQPIAGAIADRHGPARVLAGGIVILALGSAVTPFMGGTFGFIVSLGLLSAIGSGAGSFAVLIGAAAQHLTPQQRGQAAGVINAGGSFGQFVFAPLLQKLIALLGWAGAMWSLAAITLASLPLVRPLRGMPRAAPAVGAPAELTLRQSVAQAMGDRSYLLLHAGFFTCGFHIAFLVTHLPGEVALCGLSPQVAGWSLAIIGLSNIVGSLAAGWATARVRSKYILAWMYASRALLIVLYLLAPPTPLTFYLFAAGLGATWLATVPPTAGIVGKLYGPRYLATLFGLTLLSHQVGGFFGAFLGGLAMTRYGNYDLMWYADIALALFAALCNLPIREARMVRVQPA